MGLKGATRAGLLLGLLGTAIACGCGSAARQAARTATPHATPVLTTAAATVDGPSLIRSQLIDARAGWVLTNDALMRTDDGGASWHNIAPARLDAGRIDGVWFLDPQHGWLVASNAPGPDRDVGLFAERTTDGGASWTAATLPETRESYDYGTVPAYIAFGDALHGWVTVVDNPGGGAARRGPMFATTDGGATWQYMWPPTAGPLTALDPRRGFLLDDRGAELYVTSDAFDTLRRVAVPEIGVMTPPHFTDSTHGVVAETTGGDATTVVLFATSDGGASWTRESELLIDPALGSGGMAIAFTGDRIIIATARNDIFTSLDGGAHWSAPAQSSGIRADGGIVGLQFASPTVGWATVFWGQCTGVKTGCSSGDELYATSDGGASWRALAP